MGLRRSRWSGLWLLLATLGHGCGGAAAEQADASCTLVAGSHHVFETGPCPASVPDDRRLSCGTLELAEDPQAERSCRVSLAWVRYDPAEPAEERAPPIFALGGGPGAVLVQRSDEVLALAERLAPQRSWVIHDARGVGESKPTLDCQQTSRVDGDLLDSLVRCAQAYRDAGHDPVRYRTEVLAQDVAALADAFGAEQIDIFGASYGSRLGYACASLYPELVRALVLDAATPLDAPLLERPVGSYLQAMARIAEDCAASESCARWHGDLDDAHAANVQRLTTDPPDIDWQGKSVPLSAELYVALGAQLAASPQARMVPAFIRAVAEGEMGPAEAVLNELPIFPIATYVHHAIMCSEELPQNDRDRAVIDLERFPAYASVLPYDRVYAQCDALGLLPDSVPAWRGSVQPIEENVPVLALTGRYDPLSVASNWLDAELGVPGGSLFVMPDASHASRNSPCGAALIEHFLQEPANGLQLPAECTRTPDFFAEHFELP